MGAKKLNTYEKSEIVLLHELGFNQTKIASRLGKNQRVCQMAWAGITPGYLTKLFESMPQRMEAVNKAGGDMINIRTSYIMIEVLSDLNK